KHPVGGLTYHVTVKVREPKHVTYVSADEIVIDPDVAIGHQSRSIHGVQELKDARVGIGGKATWMNRPPCSVQIHRPILVFIKVENEGIRPHLRACQLRPCLK